MALVKDEAEAFIVGGDMNHWFLSTGSSACIHVSLLANMCTCGKGGVAPARLCE